MVLLRHPSHTSIKIADRGTWTWKARGTQEAASSFCPIAPDETFLIAKIIIGERWRCGDIDRVPIRVVTSWKGWNPGLSPAFPVVTWNRTAKLPWQLDLNRADKNAASFCPFAQVGKSVFFACVANNFLAYISCMYFCIFYPYECIWMHRRNTYGVTAYFCIFVHILCIFIDI